MRKRSNQKGFTILELIIASTVFSVMMILATTGIMQIGKIYYKGITTNRTQETTRAVIDDITRNYQIAGNTAPSSSLQPTGSTAAQAICIGKTRYTFRLGVQMDNTNNHILWTDRLSPTATACTPVNLSNPTADASADLTDLGRAAQRELLARNMRLGDFTINNDSTGMAVSVRVLYGDLDLSADNQTCPPINQGGQFCAVSSLSTFVKKR